MHSSIKLTQVELAEMLKPRHSQKRNIVFYANWIYTFLCGVVEKTYASAFILWHLVEQTFHSMLILHLFK